MMSTKDEITMRNNNAVKETRYKMVVKEGYNVVDIGKVPMAVEMPGGRVGFVSNLPKRFLIGLAECQPRIYYPRGYVSCISTSDSITISLDEN